MKEIRIVIDKNGKVTIDFNGFLGNTCFKEREKMVELLKKYGLNLEVFFEEKKPEAYITTKQEVSMW